MIAELETAVDTSTGSQSGSNSHRGRSYLHGDRGLGVGERVRGQDIWRT